MSRTASLLREQSTDRPTIDEVLVRVHQLLGSVPPASAVHYARQAAQGKQALPLPTVVSSTSSSRTGLGSGVGPGARSLDDTVLVQVAQQRVAAAAGPTASGGGINRAGARGSGAGPSDLISVVAPPQTQRDAERAEAEALKQSITPMRRGRPTKGGAGPAPATSTPASTASRPELPLKSADRSRPRPAASIVRNLTGDNKASSSSASAAAAAATMVPGGLVASRGSRFSTQASPSSSSRPSILGTGSGGFDDSFAPSPSARSDTVPVTSAGGADRRSPLLQHSPEMPGFSSPVVSSGIPLQSEQSAATASASAALSKATNGTSDDGDVSSRFPSVEELDARYQNKTKPSASSFDAPFSSSAAASRTNSRISPTVSHSVSHRESVGAMASRFSSSGTSSSSQARLAEGSGSTTSGAGGGVGSLAKRWPHAATVNSPSPTLPPRSSPVLEKHAAPSPPATAQKPPRDWLTGDDTEEAPVPASVATSPVEERQQPQEQDSDDEPEGPEDLTAGKSVAERYGQGAVKSAPPPLPSSAKPAVAATRSGEVASTGAAKSPVEVQRDVDFEDEDDRDLATIEGRLPQARSQKQTEEVEPPLPARRVQAPGWDEMDDESEMRALSQKPLAPSGEQAPLPSPRKTTAPTAVVKPPVASPPSSAGADLGESLSAQPQSKPQIQLQAQPKQYADAATSPVAADEEVKHELPTAPGKAGPSISERMQGLKMAASGSSSGSAAAKPSPSVSPVSLPTSTAGGSSIRDRYKPASSAAGGGAVSSSVNSNASYEPAVITPRVVASAKTSDIGVVKARPPPPASSLKPWEREAAAAAEVSRGSLVRNDALKASVDDDAAGASGSGASASGTDGTAKPPSEAQERFRGVSDLISRWQQNSASRTPGWGRIGEEPSSGSGPSRDSYRKGPNLGAEAAAAVQAAGANNPKRASSVLPRSTTMPGREV